MVLLLLAAQVVLGVLQLTHILVLPWAVVTLPLMLVAMLWLIAAYVIGRVLVIDSFTSLFGEPNKLGLRRARKQRLEQLRRRGHIR